MMLPVVVRCIVGIIQGPRHFVLLGRVLALLRARESVGANHLVHATHVEEARLRLLLLDPQVEPQTRTAKVRIVVDNPGPALRLGMYMKSCSRVQPAGLAHRGAALI
jgi:hypothetical protein